MQTNTTELKTKLSLLAVTTVLVLFFDQWTKAVIRGHFRWGESVAVVRQFFAFTYVRNTGAAFGVMNHAPQWFREPFFIIVPTVALFILIFMLLSVTERVRLTSVGLSLIFAGAVGNMVDRLRFGYVVDFLDFYWKDNHWPAFNLADSGIVVGVGIMFFVTWFAGPGKREKTRTAGLSSDEYEP